MEQFDSKPTQQDLINYVIDKETLRIRGLLTPVKDRIRELVILIKKSNDALESKVIEFAKKKLAKTLTTFPKASNIVVLGNKSYKEAVNSIAYWVSDGHIGYNWGGEVKTRFDAAGNYLLCGRDNTRILYTLDFSMTASEVKQLAKESIDLSAELKELYSKEDQLEKELSEIKNNSGKIRNKFIEDYLGKTYEGRELLTKLDAISLTNLKLLS